MKWLKRQKVRSKDPFVREQALEGLRDNVEPRDVPLFAEALLDDNVNVRRTAARAISAINSIRIPECVDVLRRLLEAPDFTRRKGAALALKSLDWSASAPKEQALYAIAAGHFSDVPSVESSVEPLLFALKKGSLAIRVDATRALERLLNVLQDARTTQPLIQALNDSEAHLRAAAALALGNSTDERRLAPLVNSLKHCAPLVRAAAAESLGRTAQLEFLPVLRPLLKDADFEVRMATLAALAKMKSPETVDAIIPALKDTDCDVRKTAVESLAKLRDPRAAGALISAMIDPESVVRHAAANALQVINGDWRNSVEAKNAVPYLEAALQDREFWVREAAAKALNRIRSS